MPPPTALVVPAVKKHTATVIMAHGLGDTGAGWVSLAENWRRRQKFEEVKFIFPNAPVIPITVVRLPCSPPYPSSQYTKLTVFTERTHAYARLVRHCKASRSRSFTHLYISSLVREYSDVEYTDRLRRSPILPRRARNPEITILLPQPNRHRDLLRDPLLTHRSRRLLTRRCHVNLLRHHGPHKTRWYLWT